MRPLQALFISQDSQEQQLNLSTNPSSLGNQEQPPVAPETPPQASGAPGATPENISILPQRGRSFSWMLWVAGGLAVSAMLAWLFSGDLADDEDDEGGDDRRGRRRRRESFSSEFARDAWGGARRERRTEGREGRDGRGRSRDDARDILLRELLNDRDGDDDDDDDDDAAWSDLLNARRAGRRPGDRGASRDRLTGGNGATGSPTAGFIPPIIINNPGQAPSVISGSEGK